MKTKFKRVSKRSLAVFLGIMMLVTSLGLGTILTVSAYSSFRLSYTLDGTNWTDTSAVSSGGSVTIDTSSYTNTTMYFGVKAENDDWLAFDNSGSNGTMSVGGEANLYRIANTNVEVNTGDYSSLTFTFTASGDGVKVNISGSQSGGQTVTWSYYVRGNFNNWETSEDYKMTESNNTYTYVMSNVDSGSYSYKVFRSNGSTEEWIPSGDNKTFTVNEDGSTVTITYTGSGDPTSTVTAPVITNKVFTLDDYNLQYTWVNALTSDSPAQGTDDWNYVSNLTGMKVTATDTGCAAYIPMAILEPYSGTGNNDTLYIYGDVATSVPNDGFTMTVGKLKTGEYDISTRVLGFDTQAHATAYLNAQNAFSDITYADYTHNTSTPLRTLSDNGGEVVTTDYGTVSYTNILHSANRILMASNQNIRAKLTARLSIDGKSENSVIYGLNNNTLNLRGYSTAGVTAIKTNQISLDRSSDEVKFEYKFYYYLNDATDGTLFHTVSDNNQHNAQSTDLPHTYEDYALNLSTISPALETGDVLKFYVTIKAIYTGDSSSSFYNKDVTDANSSEERGLIAYHVGDAEASNDKQNAINAKGGDDLWVDGNPDVKTTTNRANSLIKWNNKVGKDASTENNPYVFYLPSTANLGSLMFYYNTSAIQSVNIGDIAITSGQSCTGTLFETGKNYTATITPTSGSSYTRTVKFMQGSAGASQIYLDTTAPENPITNNKISTITDDLFDQVYADKEDKTNAMLIKNNKWTGDVVGVDEDGKIYSEAALKQIKGRGNSSWETSAELYGKYAYNMTLSKKDNFLGLAGKGNKNKKYSLLANVLDSTMARNAYIFQLAKEMGMEYVPNFKIADVYDNGTYLGAYIITQKVELGDSALVKEEEIENSGTAGDSVKEGNIKYVSGLTSGDNWKSTGTYMLELELSDRADAEASYFTSAKGQNIVVTSPEEATKEEVEFVKEKWDEVEAAVYDGRLDEVRDKIDVESFAKMYLIQELSKNLDAGATSYDLTYKCKEGKFYAEPVWDYDWALGNYSIDKILNGSHTYANAKPSNPEGYLARYKAMKNDNGSSYPADTYNFQAMLCQNESFWADVENIWTSETETKTPAFGDEAESVRKNFLAEFTTANAASIAMNENRWQHIANNYSYTSSWGTADTSTTYEDAVTYLSNWIKNRITYLNNGESGVAAIDATGSSTTNYTVGVGVTNGFTATASAIGLDDKKATGLATVTERVPEYTWMTFKTEGSSSEKEFKGWFITSTGDQTINSSSVRGNAVSIEPEFSAIIRSDTTLFALYATKQADDDTNGINHGAIYYYSAPTVTLSAKKGNTDLVSNESKITEGSTVTLTATVTEDAKRYVDRNVDNTFVPTYNFNFYKLNSDGSKTLFDSVQGASNAKTVSVSTVFNEKTTYYVESYVSQVKPDESPFSIGKSNNFIILPTAEVNSAKTRVYVDFDDYSITDADTASISVTDKNGVAQDVALTKYSKGTDKIFYADVDAYYEVENGSNESIFKVISINIDDIKVMIDDDNQPDINQLIKNGEVWFRASTASLGANQTTTPSYYQVLGDKTHNDNADSNFTPNKSANVTNELSTKRIFLTYNKGDFQQSGYELNWNDGIICVYTVNKDAKMLDGSTWVSGYSDDANKKNNAFVWTSKKMTQAGVGNVANQDTYYVDLPYNVTAYYFESATFGSNEKLEVRFLDTTDNNSPMSGYQGAGEAHNDITAITGGQTTVEDINSYYISNWGNTAATKGTGYVRYWPKLDWQRTAHALTYQDDIYIVKGKTFTFTPEFYHYSDAAPATNKATYTVANESVVTVSPSVSNNSPYGATFTGVGAGTTTVSIMPSGVIDNNAHENDGIAINVKVTVIDKDELNKMVGEAEDIISKHDSGVSPYVDYGQNDSYANFLAVYSRAIDVYDYDLFSQDEVDVYAATLRAAMGNLHTTGSDITSMFDRVAYKSGTVVVTTDGGGTITAEPTATLSYKNAENTTVNVSTLAPAISGDENEYTVFYAVGYQVNASASNTNFSKWVDGDEIDVVNGSTATMTFPEAISGKTTYIATYTAQDYTVNFIYKFKDFDTQNGDQLEYVDEGEASDLSSYTVTEKVSALDYNTEGYVKRLAKLNTPDVVSNYYNYKFPTDNSKYSEGTPNNNVVDVTIELDNTMREYKVRLRSENSGGNIIKTLSGIHYNQLITLDATTDGGVNADNEDGYIWHYGRKDYNPSTDTALSINKEFKFRVVQDEMDVYVESNDTYYEELSAKPPTTSISAAYAEVVFVDNTRKIQQNFYIQNNIKIDDKENGKMVGTGIVYYFWNDTKDQANASAVRGLGDIDSTVIKNQLTGGIATVKNNISNNKSSVSNLNNVTNLMCLYYQKPTGEADTSGLIRYSTVNEYYNYIVGLNTVANKTKYKDYSFRAYSYVELSDGTIIVSPTYASAKVYPDNID